jgi:RNA polymerase sigma factor (sigma-70 family)
MTDGDRFAAAFETHRGRLLEVASRMLGSRAEAEDIVQDGWLRLSRTDADAIENLGSWLNVVVSRLCLNVLQSRRARPEVAVEPEVWAGFASPGPDPAEEAVMADSLGLALAVVLDTLNPPERVAFVLHDMFGVPFSEIGEVLGRPEPTVRQLASRARRRVQGSQPGAPADRQRHHRVVEAFLAASRNRDFAALLEWLDPSVSMRVDAAAARMGAEELEGAEFVARSFVGRMGGAQPAMVDGALGAAWMDAEMPRVVFRFEVDGERIVGVELIAEADRIRGMTLELIV